MKTRSILPLFIASTLVFSCGRKNQVEKEVIVYHDGSCQTDTSAFAAHDLVEQDAAVAGHHATHRPAATSGNTTVTHRKVTTTARPQGAAAVNYRRPADPVDAEIGSDEFSNRHRTPTNYKTTSKPGITGTNATQAAGTGTSAGRPVN